MLATWTCRLDPPTLGGELIYFARILDADRNELWRCNHRHPDRGSAAQCAEEEHQRERSKTHD